MIYVQEATELDLADWLALTTRLRNGVMPYQQVIADCNPDAPTHWLWLRGQRGVLSLLHSRHEDNPTLWRSGEWTEAGLVYLARLDQPGVLNPETGEREGAEYQRLRHGQWVQATGQIYRGVWSDGPADGNVTEAADYEPAPASGLGCRRRLRRRDRPDDRHLHRRQSSACDSVLAGAAGRSAVSVRRILRNRAAGRRAARWRLARGRTRRPNMRWSTSRRPVSTGADATCSASTQRTVRRVSTKASKRCATRGRTRTATDACWCTCAAGTSDRRC